MCVGSAPVSVVPCAEALATLSIQPELLPNRPPRIAPSPSPPTTCRRRHRPRSVVHGFGYRSLLFICIVLAPPSSVIVVHKKHRKHGNEKQTKKKAKHNFRNLFTKAASARPPIPLPVLCSSRFSPSTHTNFLSPGGSYAVEIHGSCPGPNSQLTS